MEQKEKKGFKFYFRIIAIPVLIMLVWMMLFMVLGITLNLQKTPVFSILSWAGVVAVFGVIGFLVTRKVNDREGVIGVLAGLMAGIFCGVISAIITAVLYYTLPGFFTAMVDAQYKLVEEMGQTITRESIENILKIVALTSIIISPIIYGVIGLIISGVSALIFRRK